MKTKYKHIYFEKNEILKHSDGWVCKNKRSKYILGWIDYDMQLGQYVFMSASRIQYSADCLSDITDFMTNQLSEV